MANVVRSTFVNDHFEDFTVLTKVRRGLKKIFLGNRDRKVCNVHKIALNYANVRQVFARIGFLLLF